MCSPYTLDFLNEKIQSMESSNDQIKNLMEELKVNILNVDSDDKKRSEYLVKKFYVQIVNLSSKSESECLVCRKKLDIFFEKYNIVQPPWDKNVMLSVEKNIFNDKQRTKEFIKLSENCKLADELNKEIKQFIKERFGISFSLKELLELSKRRSTEDIRKSR